MRLASRMMFVSHMFLVRPILMGPTVCYLIECGDTVHFPGAFLQPGMVPLSPNIPRVALVKEYRYRFVLEETS